MNLQTILSKLKNLTLFQLIYFFVSIFILYATIDIVYKKIELNKYDLESIVTKINEKESGTAIGFQSIIIKYSKSYRDKGGSWRTKLAKKHLYIREGKLKKSKSFPLFFSGIYILFLFFSFELVQDVDIQFLKLKDLKKAIGYIGKGTLFIILLLFVFFIVLIVPIEIRDAIRDSDVTYSYLKVNSLDGYLK